MVLPRISIMSSWDASDVIAQTSGITDGRAALARTATASLPCSKRGGIILDSFAGSGTTLIAAEKTGRRGFGIEIDAHYVDTIVRRFDEAYGLKAVHVESKLDFERLKGKRSKEMRHGQEASENKRLRTKSRAR